MLETTKININTEVVKSYLESNSKSIRGLGAHKDFNWNERSIRRALKNGHASLKLIKDLANCLQFEISTIIYKEDSDIIKDELKHVMFKGWTYYEIQELRRSMAFFNGIWHKNMVWMCELVL